MWSCCSKKKFRDTWTDYRRRPITIVHLEPGEIKKIVLARKVGTVLFAQAFSCEQFGSYIEYRISS